jgi:hypothetical protein
MGVYLATGLVQDITIHKDDMKRKNMSMDNIKHALKNEFAIEHYIFGEDERTIFWKINPKMLEGNFIEFFKIQLNMYYLVKDQRIEDNIKRIISAINEAKTGENMIALAEEKQFEHFQTVGYIMEHLEVACQNERLNPINVHYQLIGFFLDGKIIMECYRDILHYFENNIRLLHAQYPVAGCLKVMMTG